MKGSLIAIALFLSACTSKPDKQVTRAFYHWKSRVNISGRETQALDSLSVTRLYIKFFDVEWDDAKNQPVPVAMVRLPKTEIPQYGITPVVFITNETLQKLDENGVDTLAGKLAGLLLELTPASGWKIDKEVQLDCDWTAATRDRYFRLLEQVKKQPYFTGKILSATIRLHQLKYTQSNGIPPVDRGLLMAYNMGNLRLPETRNSIIDPDILNQYIGKMSNYPLPLDIALPVFDWWIWFRNDAYKGLVRTETIPYTLFKKEKVVFTQQTVVNGHTFEKGDWLRYENSPYLSLTEAAYQLNRRLNSDRTTVILYHLDPSNLSKYTLHELETVYRRFR